MKSRSNITIRNKTNYFNPDKDKTHIVLRNSNSYKFAFSKQLGYRTRLYYEYKLTEQLGGQTFFYTLTYNDAHIPHDPWLDEPCFDYSHLSTFINGGFKKRLERDYGTTYHYFIGSELGEGQGKRGMENNPHYHILFFLRPKNSSYRKISPLEFRHLVRIYWQGKDQSDRWYDYRKFKYGIAKEGKINNGLVKDFRACVYCAKYCTKDVTLRKREKRLEDFLYNKYHSEGMSPSEIDSQIKDDIKLYRRQYCNKVRISHGVGISALDTIKDKLNPYIFIPDIDDNIPVRPCLFYYRKLYCDVVKDDADQNIYILNELGQKYRKARLDSQIKDLAIQTKSNVSVVDRKLYNDIISSDLNYLHITASYDKFKAMPLGDNIFELYAQYKLIYEYRYFKDRMGQVHTEPPIDYYRDYSRFIQPSYYSTSYNPDGVADFLEDIPEGYQPYDSHPVFYPYIRLFSLFDLLADYFFCTEDKYREEKERERRDVNKFHSKLDLRNNFYNQFKFFN